MLPNVYLGPQWIVKCCDVACFEVKSWRPMSIISDMLQDKPLPPCVGTCCRGGGRVCDEPCVALRIDIVVSKCHGGGRRSLQEILISGNASANTKMPFIFSVPGWRRSWFTVGHDVPVTVSIKDVAPIGFLATMVASILAVIFISTNADALRNIVHPLPACRTPCAPLGCEE